MPDQASPKPFLIRFGEFIRFSHTIFALPFALIAMLVAGGGHVPWRVFGWILFCMVSGRTAAMIFNRLVDWDFDKENPRTAARHALLGKTTVWTIFSVSLAALTIGTWELNALCFYLSPVMIVLITFYSLTKRFTSFSHFFLGLALSVAPMGAWAAVRGDLSTVTPYILGAAVLCWVFGFDLIYATLDADFDREKGLFSFPARFGIQSSLRGAKILHIVAAGGFFCFGWQARLGLFYWVAWLGAIGALVWEHRIADPGNPASINRAFFQVNAWVSMSLLAGVCLNYFWLGPGS
jgi:4-hydroxybenzoate polyprenyltransferase